MSQLFEQFLALSTDSATLSLARSVLQIFNWRPSVAIYSVLILLAQKYLSVKKKEGNNNRNRKRYRTVKQTTR